MTWAKKACFPVLNELRYFINNSIYENECCVTRRGLHRPRSHLWTIPKFDTRPSRDWCVVLRDKLKISTVFVLLIDSNRQITWRGYSTKLNRLSEWLLYGASAAKGYTYRMRQKSAQCEPFNPRTLPCSFLLNLMLNWVGENKITHFTRVISASRHDRKNMPTNSQHTICCAASHAFQRTKRRHR